VDKPVRNIESIDLIIFDFDGTIVNSAPTVGAIIGLLRHSLGKPPIDSQLLLKWISAGGQELIRHTLDVAEADAQEHLETFRRIYGVIPTPPGSLYDGVVDYIKSARTAGLKTAICTNKPAPLVKKIVGELGLGALFDAVFSGDGFANKKPDPEMIDHCIAAFNVPREKTVLVGDSLVDQSAARRAGVDFIWHTEGYDDGVDKNAGDVSFSRYAELTSWLELPAVRSKTV
jgi:phosphoglycolate phosphatase